MTRVIDVHAHLLPRSAIAAAEQGDAWFGSEIETDDLGRPVIVTDGRREGMGGKAHYDSMERRVERMDEMGVDVQVLSLNPIFFRHYLDADNGVAASRSVNDEIVGFMERWPTRFAGYGALPMQDPASAIDELERVMSIDGMIGACVGTHVDGANWDEPHLFPVLRAADELGALMFFHPSDRRLERHLPRYHLHNSIANPTETTIAIASIIHGGIVDRLPNLKCCSPTGAATRAVVRPGSTTATRSAPKLARTPRCCRPNTWIVCGTTRSSTTTGSYGTSSTSSASTR